MKRSITVKPSATDTIVDIEIPDAVVVVPAPVVTQPEPIITQTQVPTPNQAPIVSASATGTITLPVSSISLNSLASDPDGSVVGYKWTKASGPTAGSFTSDTSASTTFTGATEGTYVFNVVVTDNKDATSSAQASTVVKPAVVVPPTPGYTLVFESGFDKRSDIENPDSLQMAKGVISTTKFKTGPGSFYSIPDNVSSGTRSEVQYIQSYQNPTEGAVEYDVLYEVIVSDNGHSFQWHPQTGGASASPGLLHQGGKFTVVRFGTPPGQSQAGNTYGSTTYTIPKNQWLHIRWEFKFGKSQAYCRLYVDGALIYDLKPTSTSWLGDGSGQYMKIGWNGWLASAANSRIYYDNLKIYKKA